MKSNYSQAEYAKKAHEAGEFTLTSLMEAFPNARKMGRHSLLIAAVLSVCVGNIESIKAELKAAGQVADAAAVKAVIDNMVIETIVEECPWIPTEDVEVEDGYFNKETKAFTMNAIVSV